MCIRDRAGGYQGKSFLLFVAVALWPWLAAQEALQRATVSCLLYTSDAADERSSVDLGGRRIIKKKKRIDRGGLLCTIITREADE